MEYYNSENKTPLRCASIAVLLYFVLIALLMIFVHFEQGEIESVTEGILVEFGESEEAQGDEELIATDVAATPPPQHEQLEEEVVEDDPNSEVEIAQEQESPKSKSENSEMEQPVEQPDTVVEKRVVNQNALFPGRKEQSTATSQGSTEGQGNEGAESGDEGGAAEGGGIDGEQPTWQLKDRRPVGELHKPLNNTNLGGRVVIDIVVNETGKVISATPNAVGSTTNSQQLLDAARQAALKSKFTPSEDNFAQGGTITYIFKLE